MKKRKKSGDTELLHLEMRPEIKKALREDAQARGLSMSGIISNMLYERYFVKEDAR